MSSLQVTQQEYNAQAARLQEIRNEISEAIERREDARKEGDLRENAAFESAKNDVDRLTSLLKREESKFREMQVVSQRDGIGVGSTIVVYDSDTQQDLKITITGDDGEPPSRVSDKSLFGRAACGKHVGDTITYSDILHRTQSFTIKEILE